jgi:acyl carrier protein
MDEIETRITGLVADELDLESVDPDENFLDVGLDSFAALRLAQAVRDAFGVRVTLANVFRAPTVRQLSEVVRAQVTAGRP